ncbi:helix-turn-helix transcriptional regulator [Brachybacterium aquaticum]|uniref:Putative DNA-binding transcriptional regulator YafY n=1 Tax=Brachybacterium aquaticum TaxID=1432564 RepID=A0A841AIJ7_9MICO|nr:YafY family protein [Brachybacterium aquaticum]MBB5832858.1 putative DNA-binding transcriptional regulator YafY [Brachybacterium aquaticum]
MSDVTTRALRLLALLQSRSLWTGPELAAEMEVTTRTVRRDIDRLRQMGYPVLTSAGHGGGYQLGAGRALPPLLLSSSEAVAVAVGLRLAASSGVEGLDEEALRALAALDRILPAHVRAEVGAVSDAMGVISRSAPGVRAEVLTALATAVRDVVRARVDYERADGERFERRLEPYRVRSMEGRWYLFAWDLDREDWRTFRLDRMQAVHVSTFTFPPRPTPDVEDLVRESITVRAYETACTVRILAPYERVAPEIGARAGTLTPDGDQACILRAGADTMRWVVLFLAQLGEGVEVIEPPELLEEIQALGRWAASAR